MQIERAPTDVKVPLPVQPVNVKPVGEVGETGAVSRTDRPFLFACGISSESLVRLNVPRELEAPTHELALNDVAVMVAVTPTFVRPHMVFVLSVNVICA